MRRRWRWAPVSTIKPISLISSSQRLLQPHVEDVGAAVDAERCAVVLVSGQLHRDEGERVAAERTAPNIEDERAQLEAELARLDAERHHRAAHAPTVPAPKADSALADLESRLSDVEF